MSALGPFFPNFLTGNSSPQPKIWQVVIVVITGALSMGDISLKNKHKQEEDEPAISLNVREKTTVTGNVFKPCNV